MKSATGLDETDRALMLRAAACWVRRRSFEGSGSRLLDGFLRDFNPVDETALLQEARRLPMPMDLGSSLGWIQGPPLPRTRPMEIPVVTIQLNGKDGTTSACCIRVGLLQERRDGTITSSGWRFELAESGPGAPHPYQHGQGIIGWSTNGVCLLHPPQVCPVDCQGIDLSGEVDVDADRALARDTVNQSHPAFPLPTRTLTGLMVATMGSLYGMAEVRDWLEPDPRLSRAPEPIGSDLARLFGLY